MPGPAWTESTKILVLTRAAFFLVAYSAHWLFATTQGLLTQGPLEIWDRWDTGIFLGVAEHGYTGEGADPHATAIFPLYPLMIRAVSLTGLPPLASGLLISAGASLVAFAYLYRLAEEEMGDGAGLRAVLYLAFFPTAVFLVAAYSEPLFLAGAIPAFYYARRGRWVLVALPAAVAMGARVAGVFLLLGLTAEFLRKRDLSTATTARALGAIAAGALPLVAYMAYLWEIKGDPLYFLVDQRLGWGRSLVDPVDAFLNTWRITGGDPASTNFIFASRVEILAAAVGLGLVVWAAGKKEWGFALYMGSFLAALVTSTFYQSIPRMLLTFFPAYVLMAGSARGLHSYLTPVMAVFAALGVVTFTMGLWFF